VRRDAARLERESLHRVPSSSGHAPYRSADLVLNGRFDVFTVQFQPAGFLWLFGVPMPELTDRAYEARSVLGRGVLEVEQKLADAADFRRTSPHCHGFPAAVCHTADGA